MTPPSDLSVVEISNTISTLKYNCKSYTQHKLDHAKESRRLYHIIIKPTVKNYKHLLGQNIIKNWQVTIDYVNLADNIFGPGIGSLKRKITRNEPKPVNDDVVKVPTETIEQKKGLKQFMEIMCVNNIPIIPGIDRIITYLSLMCLNSLSADEL